MNGQVQIDLNDLHRRIVALEGIVRALRRALDPPVGPTRPVDTPPKRA